MSNPFLPALQIVPPVARGNNVEGLARCGMAGRRQQSDLKKSRSRRHEGICISGGRMYLYPDNNR